MAETYAVIYKLDIETLAGVEIDKSAFSFRTNKRLENANINTVDELIMHTPEDLMQIDGFGAVCQKEVKDYVKSLSVIENDDFANYEKLGISPDVADKFFSGDFNIDPDEYTDEELEIIERCKAAYQDVDSALIAACKDDVKKVGSLLGCLNNFAKKVEKIEKLRNQIAEDYLKCKVKFFVAAFSRDEIRREELLKLCRDKEESMNAFISDIKCTGVDNSKMILAYEFLEWCSFDIKSEVADIRQIYEKNDREYLVLKERAKGQTLEQVGELFEVTRERIRQIEKKATRKFQNWQNKHRLLLKIYAVRNGDDVLTPTELAEYFGDEVDLLMYMYRNNVSGDIIYDKQLDVFIVGDKNATEKVNDYIDSLPETFKDDKVEDFIRIGVEDYDLSEELLRKALDDSYRVTGNIYHRSRLTLTTLYYQVFKNQFPDGLHIYDPEEIRLFREAAKREYNIDIDGSDRSIIAVLAKVGILCDRGTYKADDGIEMSDELASKIETYIDNSEHPVFMTNTIFSIFERDLLEENIDNKYFLQGLLHKRFDGKWIFRRDYISKDESFTTVYASVVEFIKNSAHPVSKDDIYNAFPGITEIVISLAVSDRDILNLFGVYIHSSKLNISSKEKEYLHKKTEEALEKESICHCKEVYGNVVADYPELLINNYVNYAFSMYSLLEYLFGDEYSFSRPFIARKGVEISRANTIIHEMVSEADSLEIDMIKSFAKEHHIVIYSILDLIDTCNDTHLLVNDLELRRIEDIGITPEKALAIDEILNEEVCETMPIAQINSINLFPEIKCEWNEWLIYSIIKKWSKKFEVATNSKYFKLSAPLISPIGKMDTSDFDDMSKDEIGKIAVADDLDDIDNLIADLDFEDLGGI